MDEKFFSKRQNETLFFFRSKLGRMKYGGEKIKDRRKKWAVNGKERWGMRWLQEIKEKGAKESDKNRILG